MAMSDGSNNLTRVAFEIKNTAAGGTNEYLKFAINPQSIQKNITSRTFLQNTRTANTVQNFGEGVVTYTISGTTGWGRGAGFKRMKALEKFFDKYMSLNSDNIGNDYQLIFHDFTSEYHYQVEFQPNGLSINQDVSQPLLYNYSLAFYVVNDATKATSSEISELTLGNKKPSGSSGTVSGNGSSTKNASYVNPKTSSSASRVSSSELNKLYGRPISS